jgi:hypothetical protein
MTTVQLLLSRPRELVLINFGPRQLVLVVEPKLVKPAGDGEKSIRMYLNRNKTEITTR